MRRTFSRSPLMRLAAIWAVTLALAVKILVAPGMMPVADAGSIRITLCTGAGAVEALLDVGGKTHGEPGKMAQEACPFALIGLGALTADEPRLVAAALAPVLLPLGLPLFPARAPPIAAPPPATGPPSFA